ncbi:MAG: transposase [Acidimicrobiales bacterium]
MLLVGYFEGIGSQRGQPQVAACSKGRAWRCADSLSLRRFLGLSLTDKSPDHSSLTRISDRLPLPVYEQVFAFVLDLVDAQGLLNGQTVAVDSTLLEANAAMKAIVRKDTGEDWNEYLTQLMREVRSHRGGPSCLIGERADTSLAPSASAPNQSRPVGERAERRTNGRRAAAVRQTAGQVQDKEGLEQGLGVARRCRRPHRAEATEAADR